VAAPIDLDEVFHALADGGRRAMIERLVQGPAPVSELAKPLPISLPAVMQHLDVLQRSGLVRSEKLGRVRTCRLEQDTLLSVEAWLAGHRACVGSAAEPARVAPRANERPARSGGRRYERPATETVMSASQPQRELVIRRTFNAPRELVYQAFVDPDQLSAWFGPVGFSVPRESIDIDLRPGGRRRYALVMVSDNDPNQIAPLSATVVEVVENELLVFEEHVTGFPGMPDGTLLSTRIEFHDAGEGATRLEIRQGPLSDEIEQGNRSGWEGSFTKLDALLARATRGRDPQR
jgi:uncharacterized protein YndB with AHSA1/START domain/DNA-binding transcriptional ArsR family regulator